MDEKKQAIRKLGLIESEDSILSGLDEIDNHLAAFGLGAARDASFEHLDELVGFFEGMESDNYKEKRDSYRKYLDYVKETYPKTEMAGRVASTIGQLFFTGGMSLGAKGTALLLARFGLKPLFKVAPSLVRYVNKSPTLKAVIENVAETGANIMGESKEKLNVQEVLVNPEQAISASLPVLGKVASKGYQKYKQGKFPITSLIKGVSKETRDFVRKNYNSFFPKENKTIEGTLNEFTKFVDDFSENLDKVRLRAYAHLTNNLKDNNSIDNYVELVDNSVLGLFQKKELGEARRDLRKMIDPGGEDLTVDYLWFKNFEDFLKSKRDFGGDIRRPNKEEIIDYISNTGKEDLVQNKVVSHLLDVRETLAKNLKRKKAEGKLGKLTEWEVRNKITKMDEDYIDWNPTLQESLSKRDNDRLNRTFRELRGKFNDQLKLGNPEYKKTIEPYEEMLKSLIGNKSQNKMGAEEFFKLKKVDGRYEIRDEETAVNKLLEIAFSKKPNKDFNWREFIKAAKDLEKAQKIQFKDIEIIDKKIRDGIAQGIYLDPERSIDEINHITEFIESMPKKAFDKSGGKNIENVVGEIATDIGVGTFATIIASQYGPEFGAPVGILAVAKVLREKYKRGKGKAINEINWLAEAEKIKRDKNYFEKLGVPKLYKQRMLGSEIERMYGDIQDFEDIEEKTFKPIETDSDFDEEPMESTPQQNLTPEIDEAFDENPMSKVNQNLEKNFEPLRAPTQKDLSPIKSSDPLAPVRNLESQFEPIKPMEGTDPMNPEEDDRYQREEKVQSFLDQQTGGEKPKQRYA